MDSKTKPPAAGGLYVRGIVVSSSAHAFNRKDGSGMIVKVQHEIATQPGVVIYEQYLDPKEETAVKIEGDKVTAYPQLPLFQTMTFKAQRYRMLQDRFIVQAAEAVTSESVPG